MTAERRKDEEARAIFQRAAEMGGKEALKSFMSELSPHNTNTHEGMMELRADFYHSHKSRTMCASVKSHAMKTAIGAGTVAFLAAAWQMLKTNFPTQ